MNFRIADTFTDSLARPADDEQKAVKTTAFDLQINPANLEVHPQTGAAQLVEIRERIEWDKW